MGKYFALIYICLILYLGSGCSGFQPEPLDFFEVRTDSIAASSTLGSLIVFGKINAQDLSIISDHGVIWSTDRSKLEKGELDMVSKKSLGKIGTEVFTVPINQLNLDSIYFFRTFSQAEAGRIHLGNILSFSFSIHLNVITHQQINDTLILVAQLGGLNRFKTKIGIVEMGIMLTNSGLPPNQQKPIIANVKPIPQSDGNIVFIIDSIEFNANYSARLFALSDNKTYQSTEYKIRTTGGWKRVPDVYKPLVGASAIGFNGTAVYGFGVHQPRNCNIVEFNVFDPAKLLNTTYVIEPIFERQQAVLLEVAHKIYGGFGEVSEPTCTREFRNLCDFWEFDAQSGTLNMISSCIDSLKRSRAAAFSLQGKGYVGAGFRVTSAKTEYLDDFWEFDPSTNGGKGSWRKIKSLPLRTEKDQKGGRQFPFVFQIGEKVFVGGGSLGSQYLNDFWEFVPPKNTNDLGDWKFIGFFPGLSRDESASFAVNGKGYLGLGYHNQQGVLNDFWEFDPTAAPNNQWKQLVNFPGEKRGSTMSFQVNGQIYVGAGRGKKAISNDLINTYPTDFWTYIPTK